MYRLFGLILLAIAFAISVNSYEKFNIINNGEVVIVRVIGIPVSCEVSSNTLKPYFKFYYKGKEYSKNLKGEYCDTLKPDGILELKTNQKEKTFVYLNESLTKQYISIIVLILIGLVFILKRKI